MIICKPTDPLCIHCRQINDTQESEWFLIMCKKCEQELYKKDAKKLKSFLRSKAIFNISAKTALECVLLIKGS